VNMAQKAKSGPAKSTQAAPDPIVEALQRELKQQGYYSGQIDGQMGKDTSDAVTRRDNSINSRNSVKVSENNRAAEESKNDPVARLTKTATEVAPYVGGIGAGTAIGHYGFGRPYGTMDAADKASGSKLARALDIDPAAKEQQLNRMGSARNMRNAAQFAGPAALGAAGYATRNYMAPMFSDPQMQDIVKSIGAGENAAAMTLGVHQLADTLRRGNPIDPVDEAKIRSDAMRSRSGPLAKALAGEAAAAGPEVASAASAVPEAAAPRPGTLKYMQAEAKRLELKGYSKLGKTELAAKLAEAMAEHGAKRTVGKRVASAAAKAVKPGILAPVAAGAAAYDAMRSPSMAEDGTMSEPASVGESAAVGAGAAGATAAGIKGGSKLAAALAPTMVGRIASRAFPPAAAALTAYDVGRGVNALAHLSPPQNPADYSTMGAFMPPDAPSDEQQIAMDSAAQAERMPLPIASSLRIPEGIVAPRADGQSPFAGPGVGPGMLEQGNVNLEARPMVRNPDGSVSTVRSMSANFGDGEVLMPTVSDDGRTMSDDEAIQQYQATGKHLGRFNNPENSDKFAQQLHDDQSRFYGLNAAPQEAAAPQGFAPGIHSRISRMIATGATPDQIAAFLNGAVR
jgi:hypothetical protein